MKKELIKSYGEAISKLDENIIDEIFEPLQKIFLKKISFIDSKKIVEENKELNIIYEIIKSTHGEKYWEEIVYCCINHILIKKQYKQYSIIISTKIDNMQFDYLKNIFKKESLFFHQLKEKDHDYIFDNLINIDDNKKIVILPIKKISIILEENLSLIDGYIINNQCFYKDLSLKIKEKKIAEIFYDLYKNIDK
jgi:hypothetical protein